MYAICPFYLYEKGRTISCELKAKRFYDRKQKKNWLESYCCSFDYKYCAHAQKLLLKYDMIEKRDG